MTQADLVAEILQRLRNTLDTAKLSDQLHTSGQALATRLSSPVRVTFLGPPKSGKTTLINALIGQDIVPEQAELPTYEIDYGEQPKVIATTGDRSSLHLGGFDMERITAVAPVFLQIQTPVELLRRLRLMEVVTDGSPEEMLAATRWAVGRSDIFVWCSRQFSKPEGQIWAHVPEAKKDHGFLALTQADRLSSEELSTHLDRIIEAGDTEFRIIVPLAARQASLAQRAGRPGGDKLIAASGVPALLDALLGHIQLGQQSDIDHATVFLDRFEKTSSRTRSQAVVSRPGTSRLSSLAEPQKPKARPATASGFSEGMQYLQSQARIMLVDIEEFGEFATGKIVDRCLETANTLIEMVANEDASTEQQELALDAATEAADVLLLMRLENTPGAAGDAVNLILQVKRDFELATAA